MTTRRLAPVLIALLAALCLAPEASAKEVTASNGNVTATLSYTPASGGDPDRFNSVTVSRGGQKLYDGVPAAGPCAKVVCAPTAGFDTIPPLRVRDLDGDGEPEVVVSAFTGGAHCCIVAEILALNAGGSGYDLRARDFGNGGFSIRDLDGGDRPEFITTDDSFAYAFAPYAFSGRPVVIARYNHGEFVDVTSSFRAIVRKDARAYWRGYLGLRKHRDGTARGQIAPWAADEYRLDKRAYARRVLRREARHGFLGKPRAAAKFIKSLDRFLRSGGY